MEEVKSEVAVEAAPVKSVADLKKEYMDLVCELGEKYYHLQVTQQHMNQLSEKISKLHIEATSLEKAAQKESA